MRLNQLSVLCLLFILSCGNQSNEKDVVNNDQESDTTSLKAAYQNYFTMGVAVSPRALTTDEADLITGQFKSMTAENVMKMGPIHPEINVFNWEPADAIVEFANTNDMKLRGHALCWHNQAPDWIFTDNGAQVSKDSLLNRLQNHINAVVGRYKEDVYSWDVVNEAISDTPDEMYRNSKWFEICDKDFIWEAFRYAREADAEAELYYNDYEVINPVKRKKIIDMIKQMQSENIPIDGIGIQAHWSVYEPSEAVLRQTIEDFIALGLKIQITELDVSVYKKEHSSRPKVDSDDDTFTDELKELQANKYNMIFKVFREYKDHISGVTFWNISDRHSWLDNFPVRGRKDYPLLFDENLEPKKSFYMVTDFTE